MIATMRCAVNLATALLLISLPISAEVILDDDFTGDTLDTDIWEYSSDSPGTASISGSRLILDSWASIEAPHTSGLNYVNMHLFGVETTGFGCGLSGARGGWVTLTVDSDHEATLALVSPATNIEIIELGPTVDGDFHIIWTSTLFQVINNNDLLFNRDDPTRIPYYYSMGPFTIGAGYGGVSVDRIVLTIPEPTTISILAFGVLLCSRHLKNRRT